MQNLSIPKTHSAFYPIHPFHILEQNSVASFFEPLVSVAKMGIVGLETVSRAVHPDNQSLIEPQDIFRGMGGEDSGLKLALDRLFRQKGLQEFSPFQIQSPHLLLFMDIEPSVLREDVVGSGHFLKQVKDLALDPQQVVVQVSLSADLSPKPISRFIEIQRGHGFLIALKGATTQSGHLDTLLRFNPDMVRADNTLMRGLAHEPDSQKAFHRLVKLAHSLGILVIAGGMESEEDALMALEMGADLLQGKYFSRDYKRNAVLTLGRKARMQFLASRYRRNLAQKAKKDRDLMNRCSWIAQSLFNTLGNVPSANLESYFPANFYNFPWLECLYWLNGEGLQISEAVSSELHISERKKLLFKPSPKGTDHSFREYYYGLSGNTESHVTAPYLSLNSGNYCVTASKMRIDPTTGEPAILCADLNLSKI